MSTNDMSPMLEKAVKLIQAGDRTGAENVMLGYLRDMEAKHTRNSVEYAGAAFEYASVLSCLGRKPEAAEALRQAIAVYIPDDTGATRDRLTYMMSLGEIYTDIGELDQAEEVLRQGVQLRVEFYGVNHAGYGFGLEPLAAVLRKQGNLDEALNLVEQTIEVFWRNGHPRVATAFPLRAIILKQLQDSRPGFAELDDLPEVIFIDMLDQALELVEPDYAVASQAMLDDLLQVATTRLAKNHPSLIKLQSALVNIGHVIGPSEGQVETAERIVKSCLAEKDIPNAIQAMMGLALIHSKLNNLDQCEKVYKKAFKLAKELNNLSLQSQCLRNFGLFYSEVKRHEEADKVLRMAAQAGKQSGDKEMYGRSLVALGIFVQHQGNLDEAKKFLERALQLLPPSEPDSLCGRSHLQAIENNASCGCGDMGGAICDAYRLTLLKAIPEGMLNDVSVQIGEDGFQVGLDFAREPTDEEREQLHRILKQCHVDFQKQIQERQ